MSFNEAAVWVLVGALVGCTAQVDDAVQTEQVAAVSQAVTEPLDTAVVSLVSVKTGSTYHHWAFVCDVAGNFQMNTAPQTGRLPAWTGWRNIGSGCVGAPSAISETSDARPSSAVSVFVTWNDGQLWRYQWNAASGTPRWENVSRAVGWSGVAPLPPVAVYGSTNLQEISVAVRSTTNQVYTLDYHDAAWHARPVLSRTGTVLVTTKRLGAPPDAQFDRGGNTYLTGRSASNIGWVAQRPYGDHSRMRVIPPAPDFTTNGAPVVDLSKVSTIGVVAIYQQGSQLKMTNYPSGTLTMVFNCPGGISGTPTFSSRRSGWGIVEGYVRNSQGRLIQYFDGTLGDVYSLATSVPATGAPFVSSAITQGIANAEVLYAGTDGRLIFYNSVLNSAQDMGIFVL